MRQARADCVASFQREHLGLILQALDWRLKNRTIESRRIR